MTRNQIIANTLRWCNAQRKRKGMEPLAKLPKGKRNDPESCPCGKGTGLSVEYQCAYPAGEPAPPLGGDFDPRTPVATLPYSVVVFVQAFDAGEIPEYEEDAA